MLATFLTLALYCTPQSDAAESNVLRFGWPQTGSVHVLENTLKKGNQARTSYDLQWGPNPEGEGIVLKYANFRFLQINGQDATTPEALEALKTAMILSNAIPSHLISPAGELLGFEGMDEMFKRLFESNLLTQGMSEPEVEELRQALTGPDFRRLIEASMGEIWESWVGSFTDLKFVRGTNETIPIDMAATGVPIPELVRSIGKLEQARGKPAVEIHLLGVADGDRLLQQVAGLIGSLAPSDKGEVADEFKNYKAERTDRVRGIYCLDGLRPSEVFRSKYILMDPQDGNEPKIEHETHHYLFQWDDLEPLTFESSSMELN